MRHDSQRSTGSLKEARLLSYGGAELPNLGESRQEAPDDPKQPDVTMQAEQLRTPEGQVDREKVEQEVNDAVDVANTIVKRWESSLEKMRQTQDELSNGIETTPDITISDSLRQNISGLTVELGKYAEEWQLNEDALMSVAVDDVLAKIRQQWQDMDLPNRTAVENAIDVELAAAGLKDGQVQFTVGNFNGRLGLISVWSGSFGEKSELANKRGKSEEGISAEWEQMNPVEKNRLQSEARRILASHDPREPYSDDITRAKLGLLGLTAPGNLEDAKKNPASLQPSVTTGWSRLASAMSLMMLYMQKIIDPKRERKKRHQFAEISSFNAKSSFAELNVSQGTRLGERKVGRGFEDVVADGFNLEIRLKSRLDDQMADQLVNAVFDVKFDGGGNYANGVFLLRALSETQIREVIGILENWEGLQQQASEDSSDLKDIVIDQRDTCVAIHNKLPTQEQKQLLRKGLLATGLSQQATFASLTQQLPPGVCQHLLDGGPLSKADVRSIESIVPELNADEKKLFRRLPIGDRAVDRFFAETKEDYVHTLF